MAQPTSPYAQQIKADYAAGLSKAEIARKYGVTYHAVRHYTGGMPRVRPYSRSRVYKVILPAGKHRLLKELNDEQLYKLDAFARKIGCNDLMEAVIEIVRDELEEM
jgi:hypothetical protein